MKRYAKEQMIAAGQAWAKEHGRSPTLAEWENHKPTSTTCQNRFGSWNNFLKACGLPQRKRRGWLTPPRVL